MSPRSESADLRSLRDKARAIFQAGVDAAAPGDAVRKVLRVEGDRVSIRKETEAREIDGDRSENESWRIFQSPKSINVLAFGKAACAMASAVDDILPQTLFSEPGIAVTNPENAHPLSRFRVFGAGHPLPDAKGVEGGR